MTHKKSVGGRPPKATREVNPQAQFGRRPQADIDLIDEAAAKAGKDRAAWAWEILLLAARRALRKK